MTSIASSPLPIPAFQHSSPTFLDLGHDVHQHIFSHIDPQIWSNIKELATYALICKQLLLVVQKQQYSNIYLSSFYPKHVSTFYNLIKFDWGRDLLSHVRKMTFSDSITGNSDFVRSMISILKNVKLVHLRIDMELKAKHTRRVANAIDTTRLVRLDIAGKTDMKRWLPVLAKVAPVLQVLDLVLTNGTARHGSIDYPAFPQLRTIILDGSQAWTYEYQSRDGALYDTHEDEETVEIVELAQPGQEGGRTDQLPAWHSCRRSTPAWRDYNHLETLIRRSALLHRVVQHDVPQACLSAIQRYYGQRLYPVLIVDRDSRL